MLLLAHPAFAGVDFSMRTQQPIMVGENKSKIGDALYAELVFCIAVIVNKRVFIHVYPITSDKDRDINYLLDAISPWDSVDVIGSGYLGTSDRIIKIEDIIKYLKHKGISDITIDKTPMKTKFRYVYLSNKIIKIYDADFVGSSVYAGSIPISLPD